MRLFDTSILLGWRQVEPPPGWEWESTWQIDHGPATDADGWAYGPGEPRQSYGPLLWWFFLACK